MTWREDLIKYRRERAAETLEDARIRALFNQHFVKTGIVDVEIGKFYSKMFDLRCSGSRKNGKKIILITQHFIF